MLQSKKKAENYNKKNHGGKWNLKNLRIYLEMNYGFDKASKCFNDIKGVIINSLKSVQSVIHNDKHCFECYGYDIILDANLKPWLIEINASPSLSTTTIADKKLKKNLISDIYNAVVTEKWFEEKGKPGTNTTTKIREGDFDLIYDETNLLSVKKKDLKKITPISNKK